MKRASVLLFVVMFAACQDQPAPATNTATPDTAKPVENKIMIPRSSCYMSVKAKDTIRLKVEVFEHVVTGVLSYHFREKDNNAGEYEGKLAGDTLLADYSFLSEGLRSVRQIAFLLHDSIAVEGYGDMKEAGGKMVFVNPAKISFAGGSRLLKTSCD